MLGTRAAWFFTIDDAYITFRYADHTRQVELYEQALAQWHGEPFTGLTTAWSDTRRAVPAQQHHLVEAEHADTLLRLCRYHEVVAGLFARAAAHPLDERVVAQLMIALHGTAATTGSAGEFPAIVASRGAAATSDVRTSPTNATNKLANLYVPV